ncbi:MAG: class I SAM-dependent methyltransferase [Bacteroidetes bacterium]|nr:class I SAM-dependent methyltransferase [Bacteroidota bacterium]
MIEVNCDLCGSENHALKYEIDVSENNLRYYRYSRNIPGNEKMVGILRIVECKNCKLMFTNPRFSTDELELVYSSEKVIGGNWKDFRYLFNPNLPDEMQGVKKKTAYDSNLYQWKFDVINTYCKAPPEQLKLIDIGCGNGKFVFDAIHHGFDAVGIDLSPDRIRKGRELYNLSDDRLKCMNVDDFSETEKYDIIVMWDLIEHVESPSSLLRSLNKIAHKDTVIFALTMSIDSITYRLFKKHWNYINPTQHLNYFSHSTIKKMFEKNSFELVGVEMDNSKNKNIISLITRILVGKMNQFFFHIYSKESFLRILFRPFQRGISNERMKKRIENLYPGKYVGRYHDNFVFVAKLAEQFKIQS